MGELARLWDQVVAIPRACARLEPEHPGEPGRWRMRLGPVQTGWGEAEEVVRQALRMYAERRARPQAAASAQAAPQARRPVAPAPIPQAIRPAAPVATSRAVTAPAKKVKKDLSNWRF